MQGNITSQIPFVDIILAFTVLGIAFFLLFQIIKLIRERPDITALISIVALFCGFGLMVASEDKVYGLTAFVCGVVFLFIAALNYKKAKAVKS